MRNSVRRGSVYLLVKPKMHRAPRSRLAGEIFTRVETALGLPANTVKLGHHGMKSVRTHRSNLGELYSRREAKSPALLLSTLGFLDRTGDRNSPPRLGAGQWLPKASMKNAPVDQCLWIATSISVWALRPAVGARADSAGDVGHA